MHFPRLPVVLLAIYPILCHCHEEGDRQLTNLQQQGRILTSMKHLCSTLRICDQLAASSPNVRGAPAGAYATNPIAVPYGPSSANSPSAPYMIPNDYSAPASAYSAAYVPPAPVTIQTPYTAAIPPYKPLAFTTNPYKVPAASPNSPSVTANPSVNAPLRPPLTSYPSLMT